MIYRYFVDLEMFLASDRSAHLFADMINPGIAYHEQIAVEQRLPNQQTTDMYLAFYEATHQINTYLSCSYRTHTFCS